MMLNQAGERLIRVYCAHEGCHDHRDVELGDLELLVTPEEFVKEINFVCYRHQDDVLGSKGIISDNLARHILYAIRRPGIALRGTPGIKEQLDFLLRHSLLECKVEPVRESKKVTKQAFYATAAGRELVRPFLDGERRVSFSGCWSPWNDVPEPWWNRPPH